MLREEEAGIWTGSADDQPLELEAAVSVQGGRERGLILHKLMEEVLTGETDADPSGPHRTRRRPHPRARPIAGRRSGYGTFSRGTGGLCRSNPGAAGDRGLAAGPSAPSSLSTPPARWMARRTATAGIADALTVTAEGRPAVVVDWKSDVNPDPQTLDHYRAQVRAYLDMTGAERGLIVLMTTGAVIDCLALTPDDGGLRRERSMASRKRPATSAQDDLFNEEVSLLLPARLAIDGRVLGSPVRQLAVPALRETCRLRPFSIRRVNGYEATLKSGETLMIISARTATRLEADLILLVPGASELAKIAEALELGEGRWVNIALADISALDAAVRGERLATVTTSWQDALRLRESRPADNGRPEVRGLRRPQIGALHAALAHATRSTEPATIVMPTGTGKTETMLALNAHQRFERLLVVVPTDALRDQIAGKFETFGVLKQQECLDASAAFPVVMRLSHIPTSAAEVDQSSTAPMSWSRRCRSPDAPKRQFRSGWRRAHPRSSLTRPIISAPRPGRAFAASLSSVTPPLPIVQFTATPFREDGRRVDGEFIYTYPLKKAQAEGYFKPIRFEAVFGLDQADADQAIAEKLGEVLQADLDAGLNHLAMARCSTIERAKELHRLYSALFPGVSARHRSQPAADPRAARQSGRASAVRQPDHRLRRYAG